MCCDDYVRNVGHVMLILCGANEPILLGMYESFRAF